MMEQLYEVGVETVRDFLEENWTVNSRLSTSGYGSVSPSAIKMLNRLCCDSLFDAGMRAGRAEAFHAIDTVQPQAGNSVTFFCLSPVVFYRIS